MTQVHRARSCLLALLTAAIPLGVAARPAAAGCGPTAAPAASGVMREDVEVMRRLLTRGLADVYGLPETPATGWALADLVAAPGGAWAGQGQPDPHQLPHPEGVYLKGYGVVYSVSLPAPARDPRPAAEPAAAEPPSAWERTRQELRGARPGPEPKGRAGREPSVGEAVLRALAENGRHFRELPDAEQITVAVTFRGAANCTACHSVPAGGEVRSVPEALLRQRPQQAPQSHPASHGTAAAASPPPAAAAEMRKQTALGDLHLKQGNWQEAVRSYGQVLASFEDSRRKSPPEVATLLAAAEAAGKAAQALEGQGRGDPFRKALTMSADYAAEAKRLAGGKGAGSPAPAAGGVPVPGKLIVSAPKRLLDLVGGGKITFDEFRKEASVEFLPAAPAAAP